MTPPASVDLELVPTRTLVAELLRRYDHGVVAVMRTGERPGVNTYERLWRGHGHTAAGLAFDLALHILLAAQQEQVELDAGDLADPEARS